MPPPGPLQSPLVMVAVVALLIPILAFHTLTFVYMFNIVNPENKDQYPISLLIPDAVVELTSRPPDPIISVGSDDGDDGRIIALTNRQIDIFNKKNGTHLFHNTNFDFFSVGLTDGSGGGDPYTVWDVFHVPSPVSGVYPAIAGVFSSPVGVSGSIVAASPLNACSALTNAAAILGNIAFIIRGTCSFAAKTINAYNAGAIGVIIGNNLNTGLVTMGGSTPGVNISAVFIQKSDFDAILPYLPTNGSITIPDDPELFRNLFWSATSKNTQPSAKSDFHIYNYTEILTGHELFTDFPHISTGPKAMFVVNDEYFGPFGTNTYGGVRVTAFDADDMAAGVGATLLWTTVLNASFTHFPVRFVREEDGQLYPNYFVGVNYLGNLPPFTPSVITEMDIRWADESGVDPTRVTVPLPFAFKICNLNESGIDCLILGRQPFPLPLESRIDVFAGGFATGVLSKGFIYASLTQHHLITPPSTGYASIIWFKIDVRTTNTTHTASIVDFGRLDLGRNFDLSHSSVDVDEFDNMLINFQVCGPTLPQSFAVIGRKANDPPGTLRYPPKIVARGSFSYLSSVTRNAQGDYTGIQADPDCFTEPQPPGRPKCGFFGIGQYPLAGSFLEPGLLGTWSTAIYRTELHHRRGNA